MRLYNKIGSYFLMGLFLSLTACKKDKDGNSDQGIMQPSIEKLSRTSAQAGEQITVYGKNLSQTTLETLVTIHGIPAEILTKTSDSLVVLVPSKVSTGKILVTVSSNDQFKVGEGPAVDIKPTPLIKGFWPFYAYAGDNITLLVENFSANAADNRITLNGEPVQITGGNGRDTLLVKLPATAETGMFSWNTFNGPVQQVDTSFFIRKTDYTVTTASQWLHVDPAFSFMDTLFRGYPSLAGPNYDYYAYIYSVALSYINDPARSYTIFLPCDEYFVKNKIRLNNYLDMVKAKPYAYNGPMISAIVPDMQLSLSAMQPGDEYKTLYTMKVVFYPIDAPDEGVKIQVSESNGNKYVNLLGLYGERNPAVRILKEHKIGNATIIETDGELGVIYF